MIECIWKEQDGDYAGTFKTSCEGWYCPTDGSPSDNAMKFCCYCGKPLKEVPATERRKGKRRCECCGIIYLTFYRMFDDDGCEFCGHPINTHASSQTMIIDRRKYHPNAVADRRNGPPE